VNVKICNAPYQFMIHNHSIKHLFICCQWQYIANIPNDFCGIIYFFWKNQCFLVLQRICCTVMLLFFSNSYESFCSSTTVCFLPACCYASAVYAVITCLTVCLSQAGIVSKWLNVGSQKQRCMIARGLWFYVAKDLYEIPTGSPQRAAPNAGW